MSVNLDAVEQYYTVEFEGVLYSVYVIENLVIGNTFIEIYLDGEYVEDEDLRIRIEEYFEENAE